VSSASASLIGAPLARREDARVLRGEALYVDDVECAGAVHAAFVRSPHARARIRAIRAPDRAEGLLSVMGAADLGPLRRFPITAPPGVEVVDSEAHPVLADGEARYAGQPLAIVLASTRALAEDASELVEVDLEPLQPVLSARDSQVEMVRFSVREGDVDRAFESAAHVVRGRYSLPRLAAVPIEPRGCLARHDPATGLLTVWCSAQDVHRPLSQLAHILDRAPESIRLIVPDVGGAFGSKGTVAPEVAAAAAAAIRLGVPVRWTEDRMENLTACYQGRGVLGDLELAFDGEGRMLALRARILADLGGHLLTTTPVPPHTVATLLCGCYAIPAADIQVRGMRTNLAPTGPYRGAGRPEAAHMIEALVDQAARELGIDRVTLRRRNLIRSFPHRVPTGLVYDSGDFERCLDLALEHARQPRSPSAAPQAAVASSPVGPAASSPAARPGAVSGFGVALYVERSGGAWESAAAQLLDGGRFEISSSSRPHGQGHDTTFAQIAAQRLRVAPDAIELRFGDSSSSPPGVGTFGSRSVAQAGSAVALAVDELIDRALGLAAQLLGAPVAEVALRDSGFVRVGSDRPPVDWSALAERTAASGSPLRAQARFESGQVFSSGAHAAQVSIDRDTGELAIERLVAVDDAGRLINPLLAHGQVLGGVVQALGECLCEEVVHDESGQPRSASLLDYRLPTAAEIPPIVLDDVQTPTPLNPLGAKGAGEGGAVGALAAVANAVADALGGRVVEPPYTSEKLWLALHEASVAQGETRTPEPAAGGSPAAERQRASRSPSAVAAAVTAPPPARRSKPAPVATNGSPPPRQAPTAATGGRALGGRASDGRAARAALVAALALAAMGALAVRRRRAR